MCGIFASLLKRPLDAARHSLGRAGAEALAHRGPDACGEWYDTDAGSISAIAASPLSILGQPARNPWRATVILIAFNGEIYNFPELKRELEQRGHQLLFTQRHGGAAAGLSPHGVRTRLTASMACSLSSLGREQALIAIDAFGEKPLYWAETADGIYLSSELAPLARLLQLTPSISPEFWAPYLALGFIPAPATVIPGAAMMPSSLMRVRRGEASAMRRYWSPPRPEPAMGRVRPVDERA